MPGHQRDLRRRPVVAGEGGRTGGPLRKVVRPRGLDVQGVDERQAGIVLQRARGEQFGDLAGGGFAHPSVDRAADGLRVLLERGGRRRGAVADAQGAGVRRGERHRRVRPHPVGGGDGHVVLCARQPPQRPADGGVVHGPVVGPRQAEDGGDLPRRLARGPRLGHCQGDADALRREDQALARLLRGDGPIQLRRERRRPGRGLLLDFLQRRNGRQQHGERGEHRGGRGGGDAGEGPAALPVRGRTGNRRGRRVRCGTPSRSPRRRRRP